LRIDTTSGEVSTFGGPLVGPDFGYLDGKYKYLGAVVAKNGTIYCMPGHAEKVLKIVPDTGFVGVIGPSLRDRANKWQNGFVGRDHAVYGIPLRADTGIFYLFSFPGATDVFFGRMMMMMMMMMMMYCRIQQIL